MLSGLNLFHNTAYYCLVIAAMCGLMFKEREAAFASLRIYESLGFTVAAAVAQYLCMDIKLILLGITLLVSMISYGGLEFVVVKENGQNFPVLV